MSGSNLCRGVPPDGIRTGRQCRVRERRHPAPFAARMRRVDNNWQVRSFPHHRNGGEVEGATRGVLEGANTAFAKDHFLIAVSQDVLGCGQ